MVQGTYFNSVHVTSCDCNRPFATCRDPADDLYEVIDSVPTCRETRTFSAPPEDPDDVITFDAPDGRADSVASDGTEWDEGRVICWLFSCFDYYLDYLEMII